MLALHGTTGAALPATAALTSLGYSGEHFDAKAQQQYLRARWYDPANGRFNRLDPFAGKIQDPRSLHKYVYVHGDPVNAIDPTGWASLATLGARLGAFTSQVKMQAGAAFAAGGTAIGTFFNSLGTATQRLAETVLHSFPRLQVLAQQPFGNRVIDYTLQSGTRVAHLDAPKFNLRRGSPVNGRFRFRLAGLFHDKGDCWWQASIEDPCDGWDLDFLKPSANTVTVGSLADNVSHAVKIVEQFAIPYVQKHVSRT